MRQYVACQARLGGCYSHSMTNLRSVRCQLIFFGSLLLIAYALVGPATAETIAESAETPSSDSSGGPDRQSTAEPLGGKKGAVEEIEVQGERPGTRAVLNEPQAIGILTRQDLKRNAGLFLEESLNLLPGVRLENRTLSGGQRIIIRGYGNSTNFNGSGYKAYLNGVPLTDAEGTTILDDVDVSTLGRIEVIRGPSSSLYGAGIGGVVKMYTLRPPRGSRFTQEVLGGTQGVLRTNTRVEYGTDNSAVLANYGHQQSDGYRVHTRSKKDYALVTADMDPSSRQSLSVYGAFNHSLELLAGQLTEEQFTTKQNIAEQAYLGNDARVALDSFRFGASHSYEFHPAVMNVSSVYASGNQVDQPFAGRRSDNLSLNYGGRTEFTLRLGGPSFGVSGILGAEIQQTNAFKKTYILVNGVLGAVAGDLQVVALQSSAFTQWELSLPYEFTLTAGASVNFIHYNIRDRLVVSPTHADASGVKDFKPVFTPRVALLKTINRDVAIYAQVSQGYTPPGSSSVVIPQEGTVNTQLKPEHGTLYEIGTKGNLIDRRLSYELALFDLVVQNKLTPMARTTNGATYNITVNGGNQNNRGLEVASRYSVINDRELPVSLVQPFASYTLSSFRYDSFKSDNNDNANTVDYAGKKVVGVPTHILNVGLDFALRWGIYANGVYQYVDSMPLTYDNIHSAKSYSLLSAKVGYRVDFDRHFRLDVFAGGNNLLGSLYYTMAFLNQNYTGPSPNVYLPGPYAATFYGGVNLSYSL